MTTAILWAVWILSLPIAGKFIGKWYGKSEGALAFVLYLAAVAVWPMFLLLTVVGRTITKLFTPRKPVAHVPLEWRT